MGRGRRRRRRLVPPPQRRECSSSTAAAPAPRGGETQRRRAHACRSCLCRGRRSNEPSGPREGTHAEGRILRSRRLLSRRFASAPKNYVQARSLTPPLSEKRLSSPPKKHPLSATRNVARRSHPRGPRGGPRRRAGLRRVRARHGREAGRCDSVVLSLSLRFRFDSWLFDMARRRREQREFFFFLLFAPLFRPESAFLFPSLPQRARDPKSLSDSEGNNWRTEGSLSANWRAFEIKDEAFFFILRER